MENFILEKVILTSEECDKIVSFFETNEDKAVQMNYHKKNQVECTTLLVSRLVDEKVEGALLVDSLIHQAISQFLSNTVFPYFKNIEAPMPNFNLHDSAYELRQVTGATKVHQDGIEPKIPNSQYTQITYRVGTIIISLHDSKDKLYFPCQDTAVSLTKGKIIFFPPFWTHPHRTEYGGEKTHRVQTWLYASDSE